MKRTDCCENSEQKNTEAASCCGGSNVAEIVAIISATTGR